MKAKFEIVIVLLLMMIYAGLIILINLPKLPASENENLTGTYLDNGLSLYFRFNEQLNYGKNNSFVYDFSGNENNGIVYGNAKWDKTGGKKDGAFEFDGVDDKITVSDSDELSPSTYDENFTVCFFVKFNNKNFMGEGSEKDYINFLGKGNDKQGNEWLFRQYNSSNSEGRGNRLSFYVFNKEGGLGAGSYFQDDIKENEWMFIAGVLNGTHIEIYKNGKLRSANLLSKYDINMTNTEASFNIGTYNNKSYLNGSIDELRIYNRALSDSEIIQLYNSYQPKN